MKLTQDIRGCGRITHNLLNVFGFLSGAKKELITCSIHNLLLVFHCLELAASSAECVHDIMRDGLACRMVSSEHTDDSIIKGKVFHQLTGCLHKVKLSTSTRKVLILRARKQAVERMAELMKECLYLGMVHECARSLKVAQEHGSWQLVIHLAFFNSICLGSRLINWHGCLADSKKRHRAVHVATANLEMSGIGEFTRSRI
mmetsp:Transcript_10330/g.20322  ORF Transcript_10330/g.20322 Transcript_10330/m.20322 type:complete len:201 (+) Transcript_10330:813-1415(+)